MSRHHHVPVPADLIDFVVLFVPFFPSWPQAHLLSPLSSTRSDLVPFLLAPSPQLFPPTSCLRVVPSRASLPRSVPLNITLSRSEVSNPPPQFAISHPSLSNPALFLWSGLFPVIHVDSDFQSASGLLPVALISALLSSVGSAYENVHLTCIILLDTSCVQFFSCLNTNIVYSTTSIWMLVILTAMYGYNMQDFWVIVTGGDRECQLM